MKIIRPWRELNMVNIYLKIMVSELKLNNPNSQVIPSNGRMTPEALTPVLTFSTCVLFCIYFVPIIWRITKIKTTILTCKSCRNFGKTSNHVTLLASRRYMARYCFRSIICLALLIPLPFFVLLFQVSLTTILTGDDSRHFATPPLVFPRNDVWETSAEIPYWWRDTTQIW